MLWIYSYKYYLGKDSPMDIHILFKKSSIYEDSLMNIGMLLEDKAMYINMSYLKKEDPCLRKSVI